MSSAASGSIPAIIVSPTDAKLHPSQPIKDFAISRQGLAGQATDAAHNLADKGRHLAGQTTDYLNKKGIADTFKNSKNILKVGGVEGKYSKSRIGIAFLATIGAWKLAKGIFGHKNKNQ